MRSFLTLFTVVAIVSREIMVKAPDFQHRFDQQLGQKRIQNYPIGYNDQIFRRQISAQSKTDILQSMCQEAAPYIQFGHKSFYFVDGQRKHPQITMSLSDLHPKKKVINSKLINESIYILWGNGSLMFVTDKRSPVFAQVLNVANITNIKRGKIIKVEGNILIFADSQAYILVGNSIVELEGFKGSSQMLSVCSLSMGFLAVALGGQGVEIYQLYRRKLILIGTFNNQFFGINQSIYVVDLATDSQEKLFVLDSKSGLLTMDVSPLYKGQTNPVSTHNRANKSDCRSMLYNRGRVVLACSQVYIYQVETNQVSEVLPKVQFKVEYMTAYQDLMIFKNGNLYQAYWFGRLIKLPQLIRGQQLLLTQQDYIAISETGVCSAMYVVRSVVLMCQAPYNLPEEHLEVTLKTFGKCYQEYFQEAEVLTEFDQNDTCVYTTSAVINFWKGEDPNYTPIVVGAVFLGCVYSVLLLWMCIVSLRPNEAQSQPQRPIENTQGQSFYNVVQEKDEDNKSSPDTNQDESFQTSEVIIKSRDNTSIGKDSKIENGSESKESKKVDDQIYYIGD